MDNRDQLGIDPTGTQAGSPLDGCLPEPFECVTLEVPIDHFSDDDETIPVTFAILPATGDPAGAFVTIVGGPGASGIASAEYLAASMNEIGERYDLVFFDMRGLEVWQEIDCPVALDVNNQAYGDLPDEQAGRWTALARMSEAFGTGCADEAPNRHLLENIRTDQVAEDIEFFRNQGGYENLVLYGQSHGTLVAQQYVRAHPDRVEKVVLDGVVDQTRDVLEAVDDRLEGFQSTLDLLFAGCDNDPTCSADMGQPAGEVYEALTAHLAESTELVGILNSRGKLEEIAITAEDLGFLAFSSAYESSSRMLFIRSLASYARGEGLEQLARLYGSGYGSGIDPIVNTAVDCTDGSYPGGSADAMLEMTSLAREQVTPDKTWMYDSIVSCSYWPTVDMGRQPMAPFTAEGIPTLILSAETDVVTPDHRATEMFRALDEGYLIRVQNGSHVLFGRDIGCVDNPTVGFILGRLRPIGRACSVELMSPYVPLLPEDWSAYTPEEMISLAETEVYWFPEFMGWAGTTSLVASCPDGGKVTFYSSQDSTEFVLDDCAFNDGLVLTGSGTFWWVESESTMEVSLASTGCDYAYEFDWLSDEATVEESC